MTVFRRMSLLVAAAVLLQALMADRCDADLVSAVSFLFPGLFPALFVCTAIDNGGLVMVYK